MGYSERAAQLSQRPKMHERTNWVGPDIKTRGDAELPPYSQYDIDVTLPSEVVPHFQGDRFHEDDIVTRSRVAQVSGEAANSNAKRRIKATLKHIDIQKVAGEITPMQASVRFRNLSARKIIIEKDTAVFRIIHLGKPSLKGKALISALEERKIVIRGKEGVDWELDYRQGSTKEDDIRGIIFSIDPTFQKWIPPSEDNTPLYLTELMKLNSSEYRDYIDRLFEPIPQTDTPILWIGQTQAPLTLSGVHGKIRRRVIGGEPAYSHHINSLYLPGDEKKTDWPIRLEIFGPTTPKEIGKRVRMIFKAA